MIEGDDLELFERSVAHANQSHTGPALDAALADLGWRDALVEDPRAAISIQFEQQGRANSTSAALDTVLAVGLRLDSAAAVVLPALGRWAAPSDGGVVDGIGSVALATRDEVAVCSAVGDAYVVGIVDRGELTVEPTGGLDPELGLSRVTGRVATGATAVDWNGAVDLARLALAHELVGASRTMLELARTHALEREQFGRPIAGFQAVRHRLADALVAVETAVAMLDAAWLDATSTTAAMAKAVAGRSARTVAKHSQQVLAGIGFTTEHAFHRYFRRVLVVDELFGPARTLTAVLGDDILAGGALPPLAPL